MSAVRQFAKCTKNISELSSQFREALTERVSVTEDIKYLVFSPAYGTTNFRSLASVLCVTNRRWLIAFCANGGIANVVGCSYDSTLLVELTIILLYGQLKIDFVQDGDVKSTALHFNSVNEEMYSAPIEYILDSMDGQENVAVNAEQGTSAILDDWPMKLQNLSALYLSKKSQLLDGIWWDEIRGGFGREFGPTAAVLLTDRRIVVMAEEKTSRWFQFRRHAKYGAIITYFPLNRLAELRIEPHPRFCILEVYGYEGHGGERLDIMFPTEKCEAVSRVMEKANAARVLVARLNVQA